MTPDFKDVVFQGDTLRRAIVVRDRLSGQPVSLAGYQVVYSARLVGASGSPTITATITGTDEVELAPFVVVPANATPGAYDAWMNAVAPGGVFVQTLQGELEVRVRPT